MPIENEHGGATFHTKSGRPFLVRQLISDDITLLHAQNVFQNEFITIDTWSSNRLSLIRNMDSA